jgi:hypothetical protein
MSESSPKSLWDRVRRTVAAWMDPEAEVDDAEVAFNLLFIAPMFLAFVLLLRR